MKDLLRFRWYDEILMRTWYLASFSVIFSVNFSLLWNNEIEQGRIASNFITEGILVIMTTLCLISFFLLMACAVKGGFNDRQIRRLKRAYPELKD